MHSSDCEDARFTGVKKLLEGCGDRLAAIATQFGDLAANAYHPAEARMRHVHFASSLMSPYMDFLGVVRRNVPYKPKSFRDPVVADWIAANQIELKEEYQMCEPNRRAMTISIAKYNREQPVLIESAWILAGEWTEKHFWPRMAESLVLPLDTVIKNADRTTSPGYPWSLWFMDKGALIDSPRFAELMQKAWDLLEGVNAYVPLWTASLKLELRPLEKIKKNSIRTFTASPTELSLMTNRLCLDMNERFYASHSYTWSFVGCSKFYRGFDNLYKRLSKHPNAFELDESSYDASLFQRALEGQRDIRWRFLLPIYQTDSNKKRLWNIYDAIIHSVIVLDNGEVVQKHTGNPSGSANTIVDNTMILFRLFAYAWIVLAAEQRQKGNVKFESYASFLTNVEAALNGDDNTWTCSDAVVAWFNPTSISRIWDSIMVKTTTPVYEPRELKEVSFLSQGFVNMFDTWLPVPEREKVLCSLLLASGTSNPLWTLLRVSALRIESWPHVQLRAELVSLWARIHREYGHFLRGSINGIMAEEILGLWKTDEEIRRLYTMLRKPEKGPEIGDMDRTISLVAKFGSNYTPGAGCDAPSSCVQNARLCRCSEPELEISSNQLRLVDEEKHINGDTEVRTPDKMPGKRANAKGKGKSQNKPKSMARSRAGGNRKKRGGPRGGDGFSRSIAAPVATGRVLQNRQGRVTRISHRESLGPVTAMSAAFQVQQFMAIQPGLSTSFPWLSQIAQQYETYAPTRRAGRRGGRVHAIRYLYEQSTASTTTGVVVLATNYNSVEGQFTSLQQAENYRGSTRTFPWQSAVHEIEVDAMRDVNRHYMRSGAPPANADLRLYDVGNFQLVLSGIASDAGLTYPYQIGELFVEYEIDFFDPRVPVPIGVNITQYHGASDATGTAAAPLTGLVTRAGSTIPITINSANTIIAIPNVGSYMLLMTGFDATITGVTSGFVAGAGASTVPLINNDATANCSGFHTTVNAIACSVVDITAPGGLVTVPVFTGSATTSVDLFIVQISQGLEKRKAPATDEKKMAKEYPESALSALRLWGVQDAMRLLQTDEKSWSEIDRQTVALFGEEARKELSKGNADSTRRTRSVPRRLAPTIPTSDSDGDKDFCNVTPVAFKVGNTVKGK